MTSVAQEREYHRDSARGEAHEHLEDRYRPIGISSVAAAARYQKEPQKAPRVSTLAWLRDDSVA